MMDDIIMTNIMRPKAFEENDVDVDIPVDWTNAILFVGISMISGIISNVLFYFIGKKLGGNTSWKKVFSVLIAIRLRALRLTASNAMRIGPPR